MKQQVEKIKINEKEDEVEINLLDLFNYYRKKILFIIAGLLFAAGPIRTFLLSRLQSQQIEAASKLALHLNILQQRKFIWFQHQKTQWSILLI